MSVNYNVPTLNARLQSVVSQIDAGPSNGVLRLLDPLSNVLSSLPLAKPSGTVTGGIMTFNGLALVDPAAARSGTAATARIEDSNGNVIISGLTVSGLAGTDIVLAPTAAILAGQTISITNAQIIGH